MYRFSTDDNGAVFRSKMHLCVGDSERWQWFFESDGTIAFYSDFTHGYRAVSGCDKATIDRFIHVLTNDGHEGLDRTAKWHADNPDAHFFVVHLERDLDLYALSYQKDNTPYRNSIEACWRGDVYAIEVEMLDLGTHTWVPATEDYDVIYGEAEATRVWHEEFPLDEFPAELTVGV